MIDLAALEAPIAPLAALELLLEVPEAMTVLDEA